MEQVNSKDDSHYFDPGRNYQDLTGQRRLGTVLRVLGVAVPVAGLLLAAATVVYGSREVRKIAEIQNQIKADVDEAKQVASDVIRELVGEDIQDVGDMLAETSFEDLDAKVRFRFIAAYEPNVLKTTMDTGYEVGGYHPTNGTVKLLARIYDKIINRTLRKYVKHLDVSATIKGVADPIPVRSDVVFTGPVAIRNIYVFNVNKGDHEVKNLIPNVSSLANADIAFLRAYYIREQIQDLDIFSGSPIEIQVMESETVGDRYVLFEMEIRVKDVLRESYDELGPFGRVNYSLTN